MQNLFQPHPYSTAVGILIERATDSGHPSEDWALILEICDALNETDDGPKEAIRAIRKRLSSSAGKDNIAVWHTLTLLEACVMNCGRRFQTHVANREFLHEMIKILAPKHDPPQQIQAKVLYLIKSWVDGYWEVPGRRDLEKVYAALRQKGVQFPSTSEQTALEPSYSYSLQVNTVTPQASLDGSSSFSSSSSRDLPPTAKYSPSTSSNLSNDRRARLHSSSGIHLSPSLALALPEPGQSNSVQYVVEASPSHSQQQPRVNSALQHHHSFHHAHHHQTQQNLGIHRSQQHHQSMHQTHFALSQQQQQQIASLRRHNSTQGHQNTQQIDNTRTPLPADVPNITPRRSTSQTTNQPTNGNAVTEQTQIDEEGTVRQLTSSQRAKLAKDLNVVETNLHVLIDMLSELQPDNVAQDNLQLLQDLNRTCRAMQQRVIEFLGQVADQEVMVALLHVNDNMNAAFQRYDRFERYRLRAVRAALVNGASSGGSNSLVPVPPNVGTLITNGGTNQSHINQHHQQQLQQQRQLHLQHQSQQLALALPSSTSSGHSPVRLQPNVASSTATTTATVIAYPNHQQLVVVAAGNDDSNNSLSLAQGQNRVQLHPHSHHHHHPHQHQHQHQQPGHRHQINASASMGSGEQPILLALTSPPNSSSPSATMAIEVSELGESANGNERPPVEHRIRSTEEDDKDEGLLDAIEETTPGIVDGLAESREELEEIERWLQANSGGMSQCNNEAGLSSVTASRGGPNNADPDSASRFEGLRSDEDFDTLIVQLREAQLRQQQQSPTYSTLHQCTSGPDGQNRHFRGGPLIQQQSRPPRQQPATTDDLVVL